MAHMHLRCITYEISVAKLICGVLVVVSLTWNRLVHCRRRRLKGEFVRLKGKWVISYLSVTFKLSLLLYPGNTCFE